MGLVQRVPLASGQDSTPGRTEQPEARIERVRHGVVSLRSEIENSVISFAEMDTSIVAVTSAPIGGRRYTGFGSPPTAATPRTESSRGVSSRACSRHLRS
jgi:hypothetical protein